MKEAREFIPSINISVSKRKSRSHENKFKINNTSNDDDIGIEICFAKTDRHIAERSPFSIDDDTSIPEGIDTGIASCVCVMFIIRATLS